MKTLKCMISICAVLILAGINQVAGQWATSGTNIYNTNSGNVAIGNSTPSTLLHVAKNMTEPTIRVQNSGGLGGATYQMSDLVSGADWKFKATNSGGFKIRDNAHALDVLQVEPAAAANALYIKSGGNVGIRTTTPEANLHVAKNYPSATAVFGTSISPWMEGTNVAVGNDNEDAVLYVGQSIGRLGFLIWQYSMIPENAYYSIGTYSGSNNMTLQEYGGKVGIRTIVPGALLDVYTDAQSYSRLGYADAICNYFYHSEDPDDGDGQAAVYAYREAYLSLNDGTGYTKSHSNAAMKGYTLWGNQYAFGTTGFSDNDWYRTGGVLGAETYGGYWGALGYKNSSYTGYGGYFTSYTNGTGKSSQTTAIGIGIGAWGDLFGADIHGRVYGAFIEGENYALYSHGATYRDNLDVHLQDNGTETKSTLYTNTSTDVTIMTSGCVTLSHGKASITFDKTFAQCVSAKEPIIVTVTPVGSCNGVFLSEVTSHGCTVAESNSGKSNVTINYIAIGKRAGYEQPELAKEVIDAGYVNKLSGGLHNDNDLETNGKGLYYENGQLVVGIHSSTLPDPNKQVGTIIENQGNTEYHGTPEAGRNK